MFYLRAPENVSMCKEKGGIDAVSVEDISNGYEGGRTGLSL